VLSEKTTSAYGVPSDHDLDGHRVGSGAPSGAEPRPGQRTFDVALEGATVLDDFDVFAAAGGKNVALDRSFTTTVADGTLDLAFTTVVNGATVSAIEVEPVGAPSWATTTQTYRADGPRHGKTAGGATTTYTWDVNVGLPVVLQDGANTYVYGLGGSLVSQTNGAGVQTYLLSDGLGSTRALTDASGAITATFDYDAFGALRASTGTGATEYRFTGQQDDPALGLQYLRARYYDSATGRFLSRDPFPGLASMPGTQHPYGYALNNPTNFTDPSGKVLPLVAVLVAAATTKTGMITLTLAAGVATLAIQQHQDEIRDAANGCYEAVVDSIAFAGKSPSGKFLDKLIHARPKGDRRRWTDSERRIYEWDRLHGELEVYDRRGRHLGVRDPKSGKWIKDPAPGRTIEP
jgi:RHS repeat-associated protein